MAKVGGGWKYGNTGNDSFTTLLLHCRGANGTTTFIDSSASAHTMTANGSSHVDTSQSHFIWDGASCNLNGTASYLSTPDSSDFQFGGGDFTIDCWVNVDRANGGTILYPAASFTGGGSGWVFGAGRVAGLTFQAYSTGTLVGSYSAYNAIFSGNAWHHVALVRSAGGFLFFKNGVVQNPLYVPTDLGNSAIPLSSQPLFIGFPGFATEIGWLQEVRISAGVARWTSNFTPLPRPYS